MEVSINAGYPQIIHFNGIFPYIDQPFWGTPKYVNLLSSGYRSTVDLETLVLADINMLMVLTCSERVFFTQNRRVTIQQGCNSMRVIKVFLNMIFA